MDASLSKARDLVFQAGTHEDAVRLKFEEWLALVKLRVEFFAEPESAPLAPVFSDREDVGAKKTI